MRRARVWVASLLCWFGLAAATVAMGAPAITNGGFEQGTETGPAGWSAWGKGSFARDGQVAHSGQSSARLSGTDWNTGWSFGPIHIDGSYASVHPWVNASVWVRTAGNDNRVYLSLAWYVGGKEVANSNTEYLAPGDNDWTKLSVVACPPVGADSVYVRLRADAVTGTVWFDDAAVTVEQVSLKQPWQAMETDDRVRAILKPLEQYEAAHPDEERVWDAHRVAARALWVAGEQDAALDAIRAVRQHYTGNKAVQIALEEASWLEQMHRSDDALALLTPYESVATEDTRLRLRLTEADLHTESHRTQAALSILRDLQKGEGLASGEVHFRLGRAEYGAQQYRDAIRDLRSAVALLQKDPHGADLLASARAYLAASLMSDRQWDAAVAEGQAVCRAYPHHPTTFMAFTAVIYSLEVTQRGTELRAIAEWGERNWPPSEQPEQRLTRAAALYALARGHELEGNAPEAIKAYQRIIDEPLDPGYKRLASQRMAGLTPRGNER